MKVFNEIQAEVAGQVVAVLVENGQPVEFGQPLFKIDTRNRASVALACRHDSVPLRLSSLTLHVQTHPGCQSR